MAETAGSSMWTSRRARCARPGDGQADGAVARELGIVPGTLENWVAKDRRQREGGDGRLSEDERAELARLRKENAELAMRCDVLKRWWPFG